ncbi:MAG: MogA/MoaB family molybdenum cofactor biosynthesis protein [Bryobacteraceae bacterium]|jgi:molybdenum cofactor synthesis domain-containing protein
MLRVAILTISDSAVAGTRPDRSGVALRERVEALGWQVASHDVLPDEADHIAAKLSELADGSTVEVVLTTGGTGIAARDVTPEATRMVIDKEIPGISELMRSEGRKSTPLAVLSRGVAGWRKSTLIINFPGSPKGAVESFDAVANLAPHIVDLLHGRTQHGPGTPGGPIQSRIEDVR